MTTAAFPADDGDSTEDWREAQAAILRATDLVAPQREMMARIMREVVMPSVNMSRLVSDALAPQRAVQEQMRELMRDITAVQRLAVSPLEGVFAQIRDNQQQYRRLAESVMPRIDRPFLDDLLRQTPAWQGLSVPARAAVAGVLDDARTAIDNDQDRDVPEEMVAELEEQADQFAASAPGLLPPAVQKYLFAVFVAGMVMTTLMYLSVASDTANAVLDEVYQHGEIAAIVLVAACAAWDRRQGNRRDNED